MKRLIFALCTTAMCSFSYPAIADIYSTESKGEDYGDIYSTRGNRDIYTTADDRQGLYTTTNSGNIHSTSENREGLYTTNESARANDENVNASPLNSTPASTSNAGSVYDGYLPE